MTDQNPQAVDSRDVTIPDKEPMAAANEPRNAHGDGETQPEQVDDNRAEEQATGATQLPWWLAEKYFWSKGGDGTFRLSPLPEYLAYVEEKSFAAAQRGLDVCWPGGEHGKTDEDRIVANLAKDELPAVLSSLKALSDGEHGAFVKYVIDRCCRNAVYAATTQYELVQWTANAAKRQQDASQHDNYGVKESRRDTFVATAGALFGVIRELFPDADLSEKAFAKVARAHIYTVGRIETSKLRTPQQDEEADQAGVDAARMTAEVF